MRSHRRGPMLLAPLVLIALAVLAAACGSSTGSAAGRRERADTPAGR